MATVARAEPSSIITAFANGDTTQVGANAKHDEPFGLLGTGGVGFGITERLDVDVFCFFDLLGSTVADEDRLATPFDDDVLACIESVPKYLLDTNRDDPRTNNSPKGMLAMSTSTLAKAKTSAEAAMEERKPVTVDLAREAETTPIEPTRK